MIFVILVDQLQSCTLISLIPERVSTERHFLKPELLSGCEPGLWVTEGGGWFGTGLSGVAVSAGWGPIGDGAWLGASLLMSSFWKPVAFDNCSSAFFGGRDDFFFCFRYRGWQVDRS